MLYKLKTIPRSKVIGSKKICTLAKTKEKSLPENSRQRKNISIYRR